MKHLAARSAAFAACLFTAPLGATPYDGNFIPLQYYDGFVGMPSCQDVGEPNGTVWIRGDVLRTIEMPCTLLNPNPVRGMEATLYDAQCTYPSGGGTSGRVMIMNGAGDLWVIWDGYIEHWRRCGM